MATSGSNTGGRLGGISSAPYLKLDWSRTSTDVSNNRSRINLKLYLVSNNNIQYTNYGTSGKLHGSSFTSNVSHRSSSGGTWLIAERNVWVNHNSDGSKTQTFNASYDIRIYWSGAWRSGLSVSVTANITSIPRASDFTAFSMSSSSMAVNAGRTVRYTLGRKSSSFSHRMTLRVGNTDIKTWTDSGTGSRTQSLSNSEVNSIISARPNNTTGTLTLIMQTRSGSSNIGSSKSRTSSFSLASSVKPSASGMSTSISGNGRDNTINKYVQSITRVYASFSGTAGHGASVRSRSIVVRRNSGNANSQSISGSSGTTSNPVSLSGTYEAIGTITDSRGRTDTSRATFTVEPYSPPRITSFSATRTSGGSTTVNVHRAGSFSVVGGSNSVDYTLRRIPNSGSATTPQSGTWNNSNSGGSFNNSWNISGNSDTISYTFRFTIKDTFGNSATSEATVGTAFQELTIARGKGIGVGKIHERGSLDVDGEAFFNGPVSMSHIVTNSLGHEGDFNLADTTGFWHMGSTASNGPSKVWGLLYTNSSSNGSQVSQIFHERDSSQNVYTRAKTNGSWKDWKILPHVQKGSNHNGDWIRFSDGTQITIQNVERNYNTQANYNLPAEFLTSSPVGFSLSSWRNDWRDVENLVVMSVGLVGPKTVRTQRYNSSNFNWRNTENSYIAVTIVGIGRWK